MPILLGHDQTVAEWAAEKYGYKCHPPYSAWGRITDDGHLTGAVIFSDFNRANIEVTMVGSVMKRDLISEIVEYVFVQMRCTRLTARVKRTNRMVQKIVSRMGFQYEATLKRYLGPTKDDDVLCFVLWPEEGIKRWMRRRKSDG